MPKRSWLFGITVLGLMVLDLHAGNLAGVTLPDTVKAGGTTLVLNGLGLRTKLMVKVIRGGIVCDAEVIGRGSDRKSRYSQAHRDAIRARREQEPDDRRV